MAVELEDVEKIVKLSVNISTHRKTVALRREGGRGGREGEKEGKREGERAVSSDM